MTPEAGKNKADESKKNRIESYDIGVSSGLIFSLMDKGPRSGRKRRAELTSSLQVELPSRRWLKDAVSGTGRKNET